MTDSPSDISTGTDQLLCTLDGHVATVTLNRPQKRNALSDELTPALRDILLQLGQLESVRCIVITGAGSAFCAGGDVSQMGGNTLADTAERSLEAKVSELQRKQRTLTHRLAELKVPTIAALPGAAAGAGLSIALACDLRIACESAFVTTGFGNIGLSGDYGGSWLLSRLVGPAVTKELYFTSRRVPAAEALALGIFNRVVPDAEFPAALKEFAASVASGPPIAQRYMKAHIDRAQTMDLGALLDMEAEHLLRCAATEDHREAVSAFMHKRAPQFRGR